MKEPKEATPHRSASQRIFDRARTMEIDELLEYPELEDLTQQPLEELRNAVYTATRRLEAQCKRTLINVRNKGYRLAHPKETYEIVRSRVARSNRQLQHGHHTGKHADVSMLTQAERELLDRQSERLFRLQGECERLAARQLQQEKRIEVHEEQIADLAEKVADILEKRQAGTEKEA